MTTWRRSREEQEKHSSPRPIREREYGKKQIPDRMCVCRSSKKSSHKGKNRERPQRASGDRKNSPQNSSIQKREIPTRKSSRREKIFDRRNSTKNPLTAKTLQLCSLQLFIMHFERPSTVRSLHPPPLINFILTWSLSSLYLSFSNDIFHQSFSVALFPHYRPTVEISKFSDSIWRLSI